MKKPHIPEIHVDLDAPAEERWVSSGDESGTFRDLRANVLAARTFTPFLSLLCGTERGEVSRIEKPFQGKATATQPSATPPPLRSQTITCTRITASSTQKRNGRTTPKSGSAKFTGWHARQKERLDCPD